MSGIAVLVNSHTLFVVVAICTLIITVGSIILGSRPYPPIPPEVVEKLKNADAEAKQRMWSHALHEDTVFNDRLNFFLVFESVLFGVLGAFYTRPEIDARIVQLISLFGLAVSLIWFYIQVRGHYLSNSLKMRDRLIFEDYKLAVEQRRWWPFHVMWLLTYILPLLVISAWICLLAFLEGWHLGL